MTLRPAAHGEVRTATGTVADLVERIAPLPIDTDLIAIVDRCLDEDRDWLVLVDAGDRPVRLVERAAMLRAEPFEHHAVTVALGATFETVARRALARAPEHRLRPVVGCAADGRYVGIVRMERLLAALSDTS
jgi:hypothetical protein